MDSTRGTYTRPPPASVRHMRAVLCLLAACFCCSPAIVKGELYRYGPDAGDKVHPNGTETDVVLPVPMKFYGQTFKNAYIVDDGMVGLGVSYKPVEWKEGTRWLSVDRPFFAPFHHKAPLLNPDDYPGKIYYKLLSRARNDLILTEEDRQFMLKLDDYLGHASVVLKGGFSSDFVLKVTWENVSSSDNCTNEQLTTKGCPSNTFQLVIAANREHTFAIFNYYKMEIPFTEHQLAGLNGGHGRGWTDVVPCTGMCAKRSKGDIARIASLASQRGSDEAGRYILVVSDDVIVRGGCLSAGQKYARLEVYPRRAGMFGGEMLAVSGVCSTPGTKIFCRFGANNQARSEGVMETRMRGRCPVPMLTVRGQVLLQMSTDGMSWKTETFITIIHPGRLPPPVDLNGIVKNWYMIEPPELKVRWRKELFSANIAATLELNLVGYREDKDASSPLITKRLEQLASGVLSSDETLTVDPAQFSCSGSDCTDFEIALLELKVADQYVDETTMYQSVNVGPVTLGWYVKEAMTQRHGQQWPQAKCKAWNDQDRRFTSWMDHLLPCPCTLDQALADWGRWQTDMGCSMFSGSVCTYHIGAKHCVRSVHPSPDSSSNQCCYEQDGSLRYAADTYQGSTPDRSHDWGAAPFGLPDKVPSLSHWLHDVVTFYYCCLWVDYEDCHYYMDRRPTRDCRHYTPPHSATVYGDPHVNTFDGASYYFGGSGDFWLLKSDMLNIQGRFLERQNEYLQLSQNHIAPTNLTSLVMWTPGSDVITINIAPLGGPGNRKLDVRVNQQPRFFEESSMMWQDFKGVSIVNNAVSARDQKDKLHSNFTVLFVGGAAVQVAERQGLFHAVVVLPPESGQTAGLLGTLDGDASNDFRSPSGEVIASDAQEDTVYFDFSLLWGVANNESEFHWPKKVEVDKSPLFGDPKDFVYKPNMERMRPSIDEVRRVCGYSDVCQRDYYVSADENVARTSKTTEEAFQALRQSQAIVRTCGLLDIPMAEKSSTVYLEGSVVTVTGCRPDGSPVQGSDPVVVYTCNASQDSSPDNLPVWSPSPDRTLCPIAEEIQEPEKASDVGMIAGIVAGIVVVVIIVIIVVVVLSRRRRSDASMADESGRPVPAKRTTVPSDIVVEPGTDRALVKKRGRDGQETGVKLSEVITEMKRKNSQEEL